VTCVVVNDASCLIDLRKGKLLHLLCRLPFRFVVPLPIRDSELLDFTDQEWAVLDDGGLETYDLPGERMAEVLTLKQRHGRLSANDCFCLVATKCHDDGILLTGDGTLRKVAERSGVKVHGVLWIIDQLKAAQLCDDAMLISALETWKTDKSVFIPDRLIEQLLRRIQENEK
jgi:predicted nucleic acid-binding protein